MASGIGWRIALALPAGNAGWMPGRHGQGAAHAAVPVMWQVVQATGAEIESKLSWRAAEDAGGRKEA